MAKDISNHNSVVPDHERYYELCALATSGTLSDAEWNALKGHVAACGECRRRVQEYREIARAGMAELMPDLIDDPVEPMNSWSPEIATRELLARIARGEETVARPAHREVAQDSLLTRLWRWPERWSRRPAYAYAAVFVLVLLVALAAFRFGAWREATRDVGQVQSSTAGANSLRQRLEASLKERTSLQAQIGTTASELQSLQVEMQRQNAEVEKWKSLQAQTEVELKRKSDAVAGLESNVNAVSAQRDEVSQKLAASQSTLELVQARYDELRRQQEQQMLLTASLETRITELSARLQESQTEVSRREQYLASDRDIRELMGARQLYIADVYDVNSAGEKSKPYGRVFYTQGKSLIFYAFDLDQQPDVKDAAFFQAWGRHGMGDKHPVNLGIFYLDSAANKRWALKFDNPKALAEIDAVFVTVERHRGNPKPSGKQLLFASLRTMPNHP